MILWNLLAWIVSNSHPSFHLTAPSSLVPLFTLPPQGPLSSHTPLLIPPGICVKLNRARLEGLLVFSGSITLLCGPWNRDIPLDERLTQSLGLRTCVNLV
ncbi:hypothetical protein ATANTOWER_006132 [Ataeniobius toweri]|uniref:Uncharacterized protein n=1 Tax=Ataeniobius toweri TaxID=208326 RepID=A0ABU7BHA4_9TELE|nr:hypothetical protein [Ataeniobius toweri]